MKSNVTIKFKLAGIKTEQFAIIEENFDDTAKIEINVDFKFGGNAVQKGVGVLASFTYLNQTKAFLKIAIGCHFQFDDEAWSKIQSDKQELIIPVNIIRHLAVLTVGTCRGVLHAKTENTKFNQFFLPTINVETILKDDIVIQLETV